jgi:hypothetical protein
MDSLYGLVKKVCTCKTLGHACSWAVSKYYFRTHTNGSEYSTKVVQGEELSMNPSKMGLTLSTEKREVEGSVEPVLINTVLHTTR